MKTNLALINYPCDFPIKIMGKVEKNFTKTIMMIVKQHFPDYDVRSLETRVSKKNSYLSLTCTVYVASQPQLDALYKELCDHPMVLMVI